MASPSQEHTHKALDQYNFEHYQIKHLLDVLWRKLRLAQPADVRGTYLLDCGTE